MLLLVTAMVVGAASHRLIAEPKPFAQRSLLSERQVSAESTERQRILEELEEVHQLRERMLQEGIFQFTHPLDHVQPLVRHNNGAIHSEHTCCTSLFMMSASMLDIPGEHMGRKPAFWPATPLGSDSAHGSTCINQYIICHNCNIGQH